MINWATVVEKVKFGVIISDLFEIKISANKLADEPELTISPGPAKLLKQVFQVVYFFSIYKC